jgi:hypothetical protein
MNLVTCGKSCTAACDICIFDSSFLAILNALIVFETPKPAINDLIIDKLISN